MKHFTLIVSSILMLGIPVSLAIAKNIADSDSVSVRNETNYKVEFSGLIGGYATINPLGKNKIAKIFPDEKSSEVRGHIMILPNKSDSYVDNIIFDYRTINQHWQLRVYDLYQHIKIKIHTHKIIIQL